MTDHLRRPCRRQVGDPVELRRLALKAAGGSGWDGLAAGWRGGRLEAAA